MEEKKAVDSTIDERNALFEEFRQVGLKNGLIVAKDDPIKVLVLFEEQKRREYFQKLLEGLLKGNYTALNDFFRVEQSYLENFKASTMKSVLNGADVSARIFLEKTEDERNRTNARYSSLIQDTKYEFTETVGYLKRTFQNLNKIHIVLATVCVVQLGLSAYLVCKLSGVL